MAMAASVEARYPFLDHRVIEFACRLPPRLEAARTEGKGAAPKRDAPRAAAVDRRAHASSPIARPTAPASSATAEPLPYVAELLDAPEPFATPGLFDPRAVGKLVEKCRAGRATGFGDNMAFVGILSTMLLHEQMVRPGAGAADHEANAVAPRRSRHTARRLPARLPWCTGARAGRLRRGCSNACGVPRPRAARRRCRVGRSGAGPAREHAPSIAARQCTATVAGGQPCSCAGRPARETKRQARCSPGQRTIPRQPHWSHVDRTRCPSRGSHC